MSSYRTVDNQRMDAEVLDLAEKAVKGAGDGRISLADAHALWDAVADEGVYTASERLTIQYIRAHYKWTDAADAWFRQQEANWVVHEKHVQMTTQELSNQHFGKEDVLRSQEDKVARKKRLELAIAESSQEVDEEIGLLVQLADGTIVEVYSKFVEMAGDFVQLFGGCLIPLRAIEKVGI